MIIQRKVVVSRIGNGGETARRSFLNHVENVPVKTKPMLPREAAIKMDGTRGCPSCMKWAKRTECIIEICPACAVKRLGMAC